MGLVKKHGIDSYWNVRNYSQDTPMYRKVFTKTTFKNILRFFHASDSDLEPMRGTDRYDPTYKFRHILEFFNKTWAREYNLHRDICIDESIVGFKGRHVLVNYIRIKKHHQWGPKEYNLADSSGYVHQTIYHIKGMGVSEYGQPYDVCDTLLKHHGDKNHRLYVDNYYTSIPLCEKMLEKKIYVTGTVRANRKGLPPSIHKKQTVKNALVAVRSEQLLSISWMDRKQVRMLSTSSTVVPVEITRHNETRKIPQIVADYNKGMGGVDKSDQITDQYSSELKTVKCWRKIVFHLISRTTSNAYICYVQNKNIIDRKMTHLEFQVALVEGLVAGHTETRRKAGRPSLGPEPARLTERHFVDYIPEKKRKKCVVCAQDRADGYKGSRIRTWCSECGVALCAISCFKRYHTLQTP